MTQPPCVFVSYSHDSEMHKQWVHTLASALVRNGVDVILDQWALRLGESLTAFMEGSIQRADRVLVICTDSYMNKLDQARGGSAYEGHLAAAELMSDLRSVKFIPVIREVPPDRKLPAFLSGRLYVDLSDRQFESGFQMLLREIHGANAAEKPLLGIRPVLQAQTSDGDGELAAKAERLLSGLNAAHRRAEDAQLGFPFETVEALYHEFEAIHHDYLQGFNEIYDYTLHPDADLQGVLARVRRKYLFTESQRIKLREFIRANEVANRIAFERRLTRMPHRASVYPSGFFHGIYLYLTAGYDEGYDQRWYKGLIDHLISLEDDPSLGRRRAVGADAVSEFGGDRIAAARHLLETLVSEVNECFANVTRNFLAIRVDLDQGSTQSTGVERKSDS